MTYMALEIGIFGRDIKICNPKGVLAASFEGNSTYPIPTVVPTGVVNDTKCEMSLPSVLVTFE